MSLVTVRTETTDRRRVPTRELAGALARVLGGFASAGEIVARQPIAYRSTFPLDLLRVRMAGLGEQRLVWKDLSRSGPSDPVWRIKAPFVQDPLREIEAYRDVLEPYRLSVPAYRGSWVQPDRGRYWLFLDWVPGDLLWQVGDLEVWRAAARWLADMHGRLADRVRCLPARLLRYDAGYFRRWLARAGARMAEESAVSLRDFDRLAQRAMAATAWLQAQPVTFLHGEFYPSNVLAQPSGSGRRIRPLDWEMAGVGPGLLDLAALVSGAWSEGERWTLATAYREALPARPRPTDEELRRGVDRCRLLLAIQWLGWSRGWTPPAEHAHDWLAVALQLAELAEVAAC